MRKVLNRLRSSLILILLSGIALAANSQQPAKNKTQQKWQYLEGDWVGEGSGNPGEGNGYFSFSEDLDGKIIVRRSHVEYPPSNGKPGSIHDDLMIIYPGNPGSPDKAIYFDNEGHIINYSASFGDGGKQMVFLSEKFENAPRFRLIYIPVDQDNVNVKFEIAPPGKADVFKTYVEGKSHRKK